MTTALVIGAGPAGLMAADTLAHAGVKVTVADQMPSVGRKFLMAGKSGLNITKDEPTERFSKAYHRHNALLQAAIADFGPEAVQSWARNLGQSIFTGSTGRVFPESMKASPLLRAWLRRLDKAGVTILTRHKWIGWDEGAAQFETTSGMSAINADSIILALGGASWSRLGSDGQWARHFPSAVRFKPANMGFLRTWSPHMDAFIGQPVKGIKLTAGNSISRGEIILSAAGLEGGGIYEVSRDMRNGATLSIDLVPDLDAKTLSARWSAKRSKATTAHFLKSTLRLSGIKRALFHEVMHHAGPLAKNNLIDLIKALPIDHDGPRPMDQAISTAGGIPFDQLDDDLMLRDHPGVFCAGEMLDWEAPTGGYLITGCLATGQAAARGALRWSAKRFP